MTSENKNQQLGLDIFENGEDSSLVQPIGTRDKERHRIGRLILSLFLAFGFLAALMTLLQQPVAGATLCVNTTGAGGCYTKIQDAINDAFDGEDFVQLWGNGMWNDIGNFGDYSFYVCEWDWIE